MTDRTASLRLKLLSFFLVSMTCVQCSFQPRIEGRFGSVRAPNSHQIARIELKDGEILLAAKIREEHDMLLAVLLDYSVKDIPIDSVQSIEVRQRTALEPKEKRDSKMSGDSKKRAAYVGFGCAQVFRDAVNDMEP